MSFNAMDWAMNAPVETGAERSVLLCLAFHLNHKDGRCFPSLACIHKEMIIGRDQVRNALNGLIAKGLISRCDRPGKAPKYILNTPTQSSTPTESSTPTQQTTTQSSTPTQSSSTPLLDQVGHPYSIEYPNKEGTRKEQGRSKEIAPAVSKAPAKRKALTCTFPESGITDLSADGREYCRSVRPDLDPDRTFAAFKAYWTNGRGCGQRKKNWAAAWQTWVRNEKEQRQQAAAPVANHVGFTKFNDSDFEDSDAGVLNELASATRSMSFGGR